MSLTNVLRTNKTRTRFRESPYCNWENASTYSTIWKVILRGKVNSIVALSNELREFFNKNMIGM